jgi:hypothetical protein
VGRIENNGNSSVRLVCGFIEIDHNPNNPPFEPKSVDMFTLPKANGDFPVQIKVSTRYGIIVLVTKYGFIHLYNMQTGDFNAIIRTRAPEKLGRRPRNPKD